MYLGFVSRACECVYYTGPARYQARGNYLACCEVLRRVARTRATLLSKGVVQTIQDIEVIQKDPGDERTGDRNDGNRCRHGRHQRQ